MELAPGRYVDEPQMLGDARTRIDGHAILGHIFGSKQVSRNVAGHAAQSTGLGSTLLKPLLPVVASLAMGALAKKSGEGAALQPQQQAQGSSGAYLLGSLIGGSRGVAVGAPPRATARSRRCSISRSCFSSGQRPGRSHRRGEGFFRKASSPLAGAAHGSARLPIPLENSCSGCARPRRTRGSFLKMSSWSFFSKHLRGDVLYLVGFAVVVVVGYAVATQMSTDQEMFAVDPNYRASPLSLPEYSVDMQSMPFSVRSVGGYVGPTIPRRWFVDEMESALAAVRRSVLNDSVAAAARLQEDSSEESPSGQLAIVSQ